MKTLLALFAVIYSASLTSGRADYHTNTITTPDDFPAFIVDGGPVQNPTIHLEAGVTNILDVQTFADHPIVIVTADTFQFYTNADPQDVNDQPISVLTPATNFPSLLYYVCAVHGFFGELHFNGPPPPANTVLEIHIGTNVVLRSTGTSTTYHLVPEFSSNLVNAAWTTVPAFTNDFSNGTNTTTFDRLDPICGQNVFLRLRQEPF